LLLQLLPHLSQLDAELHCTHFALHEATAQGSILLLHSTQHVALSLQGKKGSNS
jgi:hypothetical protein